MKTIIAGSRGITDIATVAAAIVASGFQDQITEVVSGAARGVDRLGEQWAASVGIPVKSCPADWRRHGRGAGLIRNREMADYAGALIAVWDGQSRGTRSMIELAEDRGLTVYVHIVEEANE